MASAKKKGKSKFRPVNLTEFLSNDDGSIPAPAPKNSWAAEMDNAELDDDDGPRVSFDRSKLPTAPKASRGPEVDLDKIPRTGPFTAFVGNLSYEVTVEILEEFFNNRKLEVSNVRLPSEQGRLKGFGYVEFQSKEDLITALGFTEESLCGRTIRIDLAGERRDGERRSDRDGDWRGGEPDRTEGNWRSAGPPAFTSRGDDDRGGGGFSDRRSGGGFQDRSGDGDRYGGRRDGDRSGGFGRREGGGFSDRGFDRDRNGHFEDRDRGGRGFGGSSGGGFRDRGFGDRDRGGDRGFGDRYGDRGGDRDGGRGWRDDRRGGGFEDRRGGGGGAFEDRRGGGGGFEDRRSGGGFSERRSYDDRDGRRDGGSYGGRRDDDSYRRDDPPRSDPPREDGSRGGSRGGSRDVSPHGHDAPKERPRLHLQPRTKPVETAKPAEPSRASSIFGAAKPVDTASKEREIEEKIKSLDMNAHFTSEEKENFPRDSGRDIGREREGPRSRRDSDRSDGGRSSGTGTGRERRHSNSSSKSGPARRDSETSHHSEDSHHADRQPHTPTTPTAPKDERKMVPAPPPKENAWGKPRADAQRSGEPLTRQVSSGSTGSSGGTPARRDDRDRHSSDEGRRGGRGGHGGGRGRGGDRRDDRDAPAQRKAPREKHVPKSIDEMPKYHEGPAKNWADTNKFAAIMGEEDVGGNDSD